MPAKPVLLECTHCGGVAHIRPVHRNQRKVFLIGCKTRDCIMFLHEPGTHPLDHYAFIDEESAIKAWNTRPRPVAGDWEKRFDNYFSPEDSMSYPIFNVHNVKQFIRTLMPVRMGREELLKLIAESTLGQYAQCEEWEKDLADAILGEVRE